MWIQNPVPKIYFLSTGVLCCQSVTALKWFPSAMVQKYPDDSLFLLWSGNSTASQHGAVLILAPLCLATFSLSVSVFPLLYVTFSLYVRQRQIHMQFFFFFLNKPFIALLQTVKIPSWNRSQIIKNHCSQPLYTSMEPTGVAKGEINDLEQVLFLANIELKKWEERQGFVHINAAWKLNS